MPQRRRLRTAAAKKSKTHHNRKIPWSHLRPNTGNSLYFRSNREFGFQSTSSQLTPFSSAESRANLSLGERSQESMSEVEPTRGPFNIAYSGFKHDPAVRRLCSGDGDAPQPAELATSPGPWMRGVRALIER